MTTLPPRSVMEVASVQPSSTHHPQNPGNPPIDCYEDMFKEITRKLYGEEGLPDYPGAERALTSLVTAERGLTTIDYDAEGNAFKPEDHITAFGLAALMQNGFPPPGILNANFTPKLNNSLEDKWTASEESLPWTVSKIASYNPAQKLFRCSECECVGFLGRVAEHWLGAHGSLRPFQCPQCPYASAWSRCAKIHLTREHNVPDASAETIFKENPVLDEVTRFLQRLKSKVEGQKSPEFPSTIVTPPSRTSSTGTSTQSQNTSTETPPSTTKRYNCGFCPYATDRRDLFTRHENIHREEKPFQCYVCQKQFNRADHVKKHFLRMHREHPYDLNRIRKQPSTKSPVYNYPKFNPEQPNSLQIPSGFQQQPQQRPAPKQTDKANKGTQEKSGNTKKKGDKRYSCCYCSWSGVDNWCLKRHLNTHLKPFVCGLCDYKAARSERLATHVLKVHNKKSCSKCNFLADDQVQLTAHQQEHHPMDTRPARSSTASSNTSNASGGVMRSLAPLSGFAHSVGPQNVAPVTPFGSVMANMRPNMSDHQHQQHQQHHWRPPPKQGAERLFHYMEVSDGSEPEEQQYNGSLQPVMQTISQDFPKSGGTHHRSAPQQCVSPVKYKRYDSKHTNNKENIQQSVSDVSEHEQYNTKSKVGCSNIEVKSDLFVSEVFEQNMDDGVLNLKIEVKDEYVEDCNLQVKSETDNDDAENDRNGLENEAKRSRKQVQPRKLLPNVGDVIQEPPEEAIVVDCNIIEPTEQASNSFIEEIRPQIIPNSENDQVIYPCPIQCGMKFKSKLLVLYHRKMCIKYKNSASVLRPKP